MVVSVANYKAKKEIQPYKFPGQANKLLDFLLKYNTVCIFIVLVIVASLMSDTFFTEANIFNLLRQVSALGIISMGMLLVILTGGIDLSVGSFLALGSVLSAYFLQDYSLPIALLITIIVGGLLGSVSGYLVSIRNMAPFVVTLAMMTIASGLAYIISKGAPITTENLGLAIFGRGYFLNIPLPVFLMLFVFLTTVVVLKYTVFGRMITAIGSNESAVKLSGIKTTRYKFAVYSIVGALSVIGGIISTSRTGVGSPMVGLGVELDAIAAVVIGGASLSGGRGTALNTLLGVLILGMIGNIMNLMSIPAYPQQVIKGLIIIFAVLFQGVQQKRGL